MTRFAVMFSRLRAWFAESYPADVQRSIQLWSVIALLVLRLLFGEVVHAMPYGAPHEHGAPGQETAPASQPEQPCAEHGDSDAGGPAAVTGADHDSHSEDMDCCEAGLCKCPCAHISAFAAPMPPGGIESVAQSRAAQPATGCAQHRPTVLFRPPA